jgi:hypothetical protein
MEINSPLAGIHWLVEDNPAPIDYMELHTSRMWLSTLNICCQIIQIRLQTFRVQL